jgi:radical SAM superfamily enzyme YgiQ (UPF0313 family)
MFSPIWPLARETLDAVRRKRPDVPILIGGEHPTAVPEHTLASEAVDCCVMGEGEETIVELLDCLLSGGDPATVYGIAFLDDDRVVRTPPRARNRAINDIPLPAWDLLPINEYIERRQNNGINQGRAMPILATRGCPYRCTFCSSPQMWTTTYTMRDVGQVCDEIERYMRDYAVTDFHFQDLTAIVSKPWILAFCKEVVRRGLRITWQLPSGTRSEAIDDEVCQWLAAAGVKQMAYAPESGSAEMRKRIAKRVTIEKMVPSIRAALRHKLTLSCFFVIGFPGETTRTLRETLRLIRRLAWIGVHDVSVTKFVPYPGSALFDDLRASGRIQLNDAFFLSPFSFYDNHGAAFCYADDLTPKQLHRWMTWLFLNFYVLSMARHPIRTLGTMVRVLLTGREDTRYAKWFRARINTRLKWRRAVREQSHQQTPIKEHAVERVTPGDNPNVIPASTHRAREQQKVTIA